VLGRIVMPSWRPQRRRRICSAVRRRGRPHARPFGGQPTGSIDSNTHGGDDALYAQLAPRLRARVGRLFNDKMP